MNVAPLLGRTSVALVASASVLAAGCGGSEPGPAERPKAVRYVALGDSYTIGEGVEPRERWPDLVAARLRREGAPTEVVANPSVTGYTTRDVMRQEIPALRRARADLATLQIGVNDWVQGTSASRFRAQLAQLLDEIPRHLSDPRALVVVTIPDFASTPAGALFTSGRDGTAGIRRFNAIVGAEAERRGLAVADVFGISRQVRADGSLVASDGLHPSAKQYARWAGVIGPVVRRTLERTGAVTRPKGP